MRHVKWLAPLMVVLAMVFSLGAGTNVISIQAEEQTEETSQETTPEETTTEETDGTQTDEGTSDGTSEETQSEDNGISPLSDEGIAPLAEGDVAQIGDQTYATLDEAIDAASKDGTATTIVLLADATCSGMSLYEDLTIVAADGLASTPTITFTDKGIGLGYGGHAPNLVFKNINVNMLGATSINGEWSWMSICASKDGTLTLDHTNMTMDASTATNNPHAIYFTGNNVLNIINGSNLTIRNYKQDALEWDGGDVGYFCNIIDSTFVSDHNRSGFTGTFYATITRSKVDVINSTGNGSNGSHFIITDCPMTETTGITFSNNGSHGLSTGILTVTNSDIVANNNGMCGVIFNNKATFTNADVTITGTRGISYWNAAMRAYTVNASATIDAASTFTITDNAVTGIFLDANTSLDIAEGAAVTVTRNYAYQDNCSTKRDLAQSGGGIVVRDGATANLSSTTVLYNNHALNAGDDIYLEGDGTITFTEVTSAKQWMLDGNRDDARTHCSHLITGWFDDSAGSRWEAHAENTENNYIKEVDPEEGTTVLSLTGEKALKAAHDLKTYTITIYYVEEETNVRIKDTVTITDVPRGSAYDVTEYDKVDINGFTYTRTVGDLTGNNIESDIEITVYYKRNPEKPKEEDKTDKTETTKTDGNNTGVTLSLAGVFGTMSVALGGMIALISRKRK